MKSTTPAFRSAIATRLPRFHILADSFGFLLPTRRTTRRGRHPSTLKQVGYNDVTSSIDRFEQSAELCASIEPKIAIQGSNRAARPLNCLERGELPFYGGPEATNCRPITREISLATIPCIARRSVPRRKALENSWMRATRIRGGFESFFLITPRRDPLIAPKHARPLARVLKSFGRGSVIALASFLSRRCSFVRH